MYDHPRGISSLCLGAVLLCFGCTEDEGDTAADTGILTDAGETANVDTGDGDGDSGDGDEDPGDGDPGDGDGDPTTDTGEPECDGTSPYMGGWDIGCCQDEIDPQNGWAPGGVHVGTIMPDYTFTDQFGEALRLYDFCHNAIWFEYVALW